jgi:hypothetical protein
MTIPVLVYITTNIKWLYGWSGIINSWGGWMVEPMRLLSVASHSIQCTLQQPGTTDSISQKCVCLITACPCKQQFKTAWTCECSTILWGTLQCIAFIFPMSMTSLSQTKPASTSTSRQLLCSGSWYNRHSALTSHYCITTQKTVSQYFPVDVAYEPNCSQVFTIQHDKTTQKTCTSVTLPTKPLRYYNA